MELKPCTNDVISVIAIWPVIIICELIFLIIIHFNIHFSACSYFWTSFCVSFLFVILFTSQGG